MPDLTARAKRMLACFQAEAADAPNQPDLNLDALDAIMAESELVRGGYIERVAAGWRLTPKGSVANVGTPTRRGRTLRLL